MSARKEQLKVMLQMAATLARIESRLADLWDLQAAAAGSKTTTYRVRGANDVIRKGVPLRSMLRSGGGVSLAPDQQ